MSVPENSSSRFTAQAATTEDLLKTQTVGLVQLDEFRKRRRDVEELKLRDTPEQSDGTLTPRSDDGTPGPVFKKKKRKIAGRGLLSFGHDDGDGEEGDQSSTSREATPATKGRVAPGSTTPIQRVQHTSEPIRRRLTPNPNAGIPMPKVMTKATLAAEAAERERLRKEFTELQEQVRASEVAIPFVFYNGSSMPGGTVKIKKGDQIWLFLERCRKVGAELGVDSDKSTAMDSKLKVESKKSWARIGVDDLMCVRGEIIIPHHYELYYFIANKVVDPSHPQQLLFDYRGTAEQKMLPKQEEEALLIRRPKDEITEGQDQDPNYTKVVDRRWYEKNKHIYPASLWKDYKAGKEFEESARSRKDAQGNAFFFS